jgi:hypothetical protein
MGHKPMYTASTYPGTASWKARIGIIVFHLEFNLCIFGFRFWPSILTFLGCIGTRGEGEKAGEGTEGALTAGIYFFNILTFGPVGPDP